LRHGDDEQTFLAVAWHQDLAVLTALEQGLEAVEPQIALLPLLAVTSEARRFKERTDIFRVRNSLPGGRRREFREIKFAEVGLLSSHERPSGSREADHEQC
jgi:hypothetical protein